MLFTSIRTRAAGAALLLASGLLAAGAADADPGATPTTPDAPNASAETASADRASPDTAFAGRRAELRERLAQRDARRRAPDADDLRAGAGFERLPESLHAMVERKIAKKTGAAPTTGGADAIAFFMHQRVPEGEEYPINRVRAIAEAEYAQAARLRAREMQAGGFSRSNQLGLTTPIIDGWRPLGPGNVGGRTRAMVISPNGPGTGMEGDEGFMLAAGVSGGIFKTTDGGASWRPVADSMENIAVCSMVMDPTDPQVIYAGTGEGFSNGGAVRGLGIFKSTDGGETWAQLEETVTPFVSPFAFHYVNKLAISPADNKRIYAATQTGVWIHENAGEPTNANGDEFTWRLVLGNPFWLIGSQNSRGSLVGATDVQVRPAPASGIADPVEEEVVLAAFGGFFADGLFVSPNGGERWFRVEDLDASEETLSRIDTPAQGRMSIAFSSRASSGDAGVAYVLMARNEDFFDPDLPEAADDLPFGAVLDVFRADLSGLEIIRDDQDNITDVVLPFEPRLNLLAGANPLNRLLLSNGLFSGVCTADPEPRLSQGWYDNIIKVDPTDRNVVWAGGIDLFRSGDGGRNFGQASYWFFDPAEDAYVHADQHEIVFHPDYDGAMNTTMYVTNDGGVFRTDNATAPVTFDACPFPNPDEGYIPAEPEIVFESLNNGYGVTQFYHGDTGTTRTGGRDLYVGGTQDNGTVRTFQRRCTEDWDEILGGDGGYVAVNPLDNDEIFATTQGFGNIYRTTIRDGLDGPFESVDLVSSPIRNRDVGLFITPFAMDPNDPDVLWTGGLRPWRTQNAGESFNEFVFWLPGPDLNLSGLPAGFDIVGRVSAIAVAPSDSNIVYMGTEDGWVARTSNALAPRPTWQVLSIGLPIETGYISSIAVDPVDPNIVWVTNARFTEFDPFNPSPDSNLYRGTCEGDCNDPNAWVFLPMDGFDCDQSDDINPVLPDVPAHWVSIRRCGTNACATGQCLVFVGTEIGVYVSEDAYGEDLDCAPDGVDPSDSVSWRLLNIGDDPDIGVLPSTVVETLDFRDNNTVVAFTHGRGAFLANILRECPGVSLGEPCNPADLAAPFGQIGAEDFTQWSIDTALGRLSVDMPMIGEDCGDGVLDLNDITQFVALFQAGCP